MCETKEQEDKFDKLLVACVMRSKHLAALGASSIIAPVTRSLSVTCAKPQPKWSKIEEMGEKMVQSLKRVHNFSSLQFQIDAS